MRRWMNWTVVLSFVLVTTATTETWRSPATTQLVQGWSYDDPDWPPDPDPDPDDDGPSGIDLSELIPA